ncbi:MAG: hypothetical protein ACHQ0J_05630 [Candidatus Dormibacterales bacterium]
MAVVTAGSPLSTISRRTWIAMAALVLLAGAYGYFAVYLQPLAPADEQLNPAAGEARIASSTIDFGPLVYTPLAALTYVDGANATLVKDLYNNGPFALTVTGVETSPEYWVGLVSVADPRAAVMAGPWPCCEINEAATFSAQSFHPFQLSPGRLGAVAVHLFMSHCEDSGPGGYLGIDRITVLYSVLGFPHSQDVPVGPYWFQSPNSCPRTGSARP